MNLYLDTSALLVLILEEREPDALLAAISAADRIYTAVVALPEALCALERRRRGGLLRAAAYKRAVAEVRAAWPNLSRIVVDEPLSEEAAKLGAAHGLRGYDAVHLAAAVLVHRASPTALATWDRELHGAARAAGLAVVPEVIV